MLFSLSEVWFGTVKILSRRYLLDKNQRNMTPPIRVVAGYMKLQLSAIHTQACIYTLFTYVRMSN